MDRSGLRKNFKLVCVKTTLNKFRRYMTNWENISNLYNKEKMAILKELLQIKRNIYIYIFQYNKSVKEHDIFLKIG